MNAPTDITLEMVEEALKDIEEESDRASKWLWTPRKEKEKILAKMREDMDKMPSKPIDKRFVFDIPPQFQKRAVA